MGRNFDSKMPPSNLVDSVSFAAEGDWAIEMMGDAYLRVLRGWQRSRTSRAEALERINASLPNDHGQNWDRASPPEAHPANSNARSPAPLILRQVTHAPAIPRSSEPVDWSVARSLDESSSAAGRRPSAPRRRCRFRLAAAFVP